MTDRHSGYIVTLKDSIREDEAAQIMTALRQIRGVCDVRVIPDGANIAGIGLAIRTEAKWRDAVFNLAMNGPAIEGGKS